MFLFLIRRREITAQEVATLNQEVATGSGSNSQLNAGKLGFCWFFGFVM